ncbi:FecR domain-containing protein [Reyranella sp.]|uniref:FecR family protein n=1 Tax=Reyranella sp. TaxID=1929291 RepID=UPI0025CBEC41|nr:FecR domain-containing protein [Reyranella sp.]
MSGDDDMIPDRVLEAASAWAFRLQDAPDDAGLRAELADWLAESDVHAEAWALTQRAWQVTGQARAAFAHEWPTASSTRSVVSRPTVSHGQSNVTPLRRRRFGVRVTALAIAACLLLVFALPVLRVQLNASHATSVAEMREVSLEDGSRVTLAASSAISVSFAAGAREVTLLEGAAYFEVAPDRARPFTVRAGPVSTTVTGTAFDVAMTDRTVSVAVASGSVRVARTDNLSSSLADLGAQQGVVVDRSSGTVVETALQPGTVAAWRKGRLIVENALLTDVVAALDRSHAGSIVVASESLRGKRVTGVYDLADPAGALRVLSAPYGGVVRAFTPYLLVLSVD